MTIFELSQKLNLKVISGAAGIHNEISGAYVSDLLSDVMGFAREGEVWITLQTHRNVIAIASLKDLSGIILVKDNLPGQESIEASNEEGIPVLSSSLNTFELCGLIYNLIKCEQNT